MKASRAYRTRKALIHGIARCTVCDWDCEKYLVVERRAAEHAKRTGHTVKAELGYVVDYSVEPLR